MSKWQSGKKAVRVIIGGAAAIAAVAVAVKIAIGPQFQRAIPQPSRPPVPNFSHVVVIMMENHGDAALLGNRAAPYINQLVRRDGFDRNYFGVTHVSLPNYVALLTGETGHTHSDDPNQTFNQRSLPQQLTAVHKTWQAVMQSIPSSNFQGNWYPGNAQSTTPPSNALYAKKHNPFALLLPLRSSLARHTVTLSRFQEELQQGHVPQFVWITPNLCDDMHGQQPGPGNSCPVSSSQHLVQSGDRFLARLIPQIIHSKSWNRRSVLFLTWDETNTPANLLSVENLRRYLAPGPASPVVPWVHIAIGGGKIPLIVIVGQGEKIDTNLWVDHYSILKTIEDSWHLRYLGHANSAQVPVLLPFFKKQ
ncbi:MAG: phosphoesterase [Sulfobacillus thermosulfidooxidans]|nr:MAG: phosphoesterase [Sulfobacillus thermosulfidooxidans]